MTNSTDPDQLASSKPTDLDLHCLQSQDLSGFSRTRVKGICNDNLNHFLHFAIKACVLSTDNMFS